MNAPDTGYRQAFDAWAAGEHANALELCRELLRNFPDYSIGRLLEGIVLSELARYDEAEQMINEAIQGLSIEALPHGYMHLAHLHRDRGRYDEAEKWYHKAVELDPDNAGLHVFLGALLAKKGDLQQAEASHRKATQCSRGAVDEAFLNLGLVLRAQERYQEALECFQKALEIATDDPDAKLAKSDVEKAITFLRPNA
jgi:tetratricopeptide (TPR) repeat protein